MRRDARCRASCVHAPLERAYKELQTPLCPFLWQGKVRGKAFCPEEGLIVVHTILRNVKRAFIAFLC